MIYTQPMHLKKSIPLFMALWSLTNTAQEGPRIYKAPEFDRERRMPTNHPDRIILSLGEDPATTATVT